MDAATASTSAAAVPSKRVTYVIPPCSVRPPRLELPDIGAGRHPSRPTKGSSYPLLRPHPNQDDDDCGPSSKRAIFGREHPRHALPVTSLAVDPSTSILDHGTSTPRGILYTAGRDGLVASWQLNLNMRKRPREQQLQLRSRARAHGVGDDDDDEESDWVFSEREEEEYQEGGQGDPATQSHGPVDEASAWEALPFERQWAVDTDWLLDEERSTRRHPQSGFRSCVQSHTDWINDMLLCNMNQTVITASSDRFIRMWNPHDPATCLSPSVLGSHSDYVKALAYPTALSASWVASGGLDRRVRLWDLKEARQSPIVDISDSASAYCLNTDAKGGIIAVGTPDSGIRLYDPRSDSRMGPIGQLLGHTDMIRSILVSKSGRRLLSSSSDGTVRLWDVGEQRLVHTFSHHSTSVTALHSNCDDLDVFYSADRDGWLCKIDGEQCEEPDEGECVVLAQSDGPIHKIAALDDAFVWTCGSGSDVECWRDVPRRRQRQAMYPLHHAEHFGRRASSPDPLVASPAARKDWTRFSVDTAHTVTGDHSPSASDARPPLQSALKNSHGSHGSHGSASTSVPPLPPPAPHHQSSGISRVSFSLDQIESHHVSSPRADTPRRISSPSPHSKAASAKPLPLVKGVHPSATLFGIPFDSLVCIASDEDAFGLGTGVGTGFGAGSIGAGLGSTMSLRGSTLHLGGGQPSTALTGTTAEGHRDPSFSLGRPSLGLDGQSLPSGTTPAIARLAQLKAASHHAPPSARPASLRSTSASIRFAPRSSDLTPEADLALPEEPDSEEDASDDDEIATAARRAFEERDIAAKATPLRDAPVELIQGVRGLIRSSMLNDRRHVLTYAAPALRHGPPSGRGEPSSKLLGPEVGIWDVLRGKCLGIFSGSEVSSLVQVGDTPGDLLERIKERIEGQGATSAWCSVDTRNGSLAVHLDYPTVFEAEVYLDECEWVKREAYVRDDQRANLGKWLLRSLFNEFVDSEVSMRNGEAASLSPGQLAVERPDVVPNQPFKLNLHERRGRTMGTITTRPEDATTPTARAPGNTLAFAVAPDTPALTPKGAAPLTPSLDATFPAMATLAEGLAASESSEDKSDYFGSGSGKKEEVKSELKAEGSKAASRPTTPGSAGQATDAAGGTMETLASPTTPGGGLMGRLGAKFGRSKGDKAVTPGVAASATTSATAGTAASSEAAATPTAGAAAEASNEHKGDPAVVALNRAVLSKAMTPIALNEAPLLDLSAKTAILISSASSDAAQWETVYRGMVSSTSRDLAALELAAPAWLLDFVLRNKIAAAPRAGGKMSFILSPAAAAAPGATPGSAGTQPQQLPPLPSGEAKLTATRMLRVGKAATYVCEKLGYLRATTPPKSGQASIIGGSRRPSADVNAGNGVNATATAPAAGTGTGAAAVPGKLTKQSSALNLSMTSLAEGGRDSSSDQVSLPQPDDLELLCNGVVLDSCVTLAQVARFYWKSSGDPKIEYRLRARASADADESVESI